MIIVSDTSSISNLLQIGLIGILKTMYGEVIITPAVQRELYRLDIQQEKLEKIDWIKVMSPMNQKMVGDLMNDLDLGESESIALAYEINADYLIIDEYFGRSIAEKMGIRIVWSFRCFDSSKETWADYKLETRIGQTAFNWV